ncbi:MAG: glycosyltransferase family 39 protein, partial [Planctomycetota bacterium]
MAKTGRRQRDVDECEGASERIVLRVAGPVLISLAATVATLATLAPEGGGPGVTCDEGYHVAAGKRLVLALRQQGVGFFRPANVAANFDWPADGLPVHPPLGNGILGGVHHLFDMAPDDLGIISIVPARFAAALAIGFLVLLVGLWATRVDGPVAGCVAAVAVVLVPRVFAHGHLAALDTLTALFFVAAVLAVAEADARGGRPWYYAAAGVVWGLAMLVRIHGLLVLPPVALWLVWRLRRRAVLPLVVWAAAGLATFFAGWPWLWLAPIAHFRQLLGTATGRQAVHVFYAGRVWADHEVPWHYPLVMFVVALPLGLLLLGLLGAWANRRVRKTDPGYLLVMGSLLFMLLLFAWPGTPVYDGVRLFLMVFPLWAIF